MRNEFPILVFSERTNDLIHLAIRGEERERQAGLGACREALVDRPVDVLLAGILLVPFVARLVDDLPGYRLDLRGRRRADGQRPCDHQRPNKEPGHSDSPEVWIQARLLVIDLNAELEQAAAED